jgi:hypothetical protein
MLLLLFIGQLLNAFFAILEILPSLVKLFANRHLYFSVPF